MKRIISVLMVLALILTIMPLTGTLKVSAANSSKTVSEALAWCDSKVGTSIDYDGAYGAQCVDLISAYLSYLGIPTIPCSNTGYAKDYASVSYNTNYLTRIQGATPQPGDILIWTGTYGHVAICKSSSQAYHQNFEGQYVTVNSYVNKNFTYSGSTVTYWGVLRPNFKASSGGSTTTTTYTSISSGVYSFKNKSNGNYMNLAYGKDEDKANIHGHDTYYNSSCRYSISKGTYGYEIKPTASSTRIVNAWGDNPGNGSNVNIYPDQGNDKTQQWLFESVSGGYIIHLASNTNLVLTQTSSNAYNIEVSTRTGASNQIWILENATAYTISFDANGGTGAPASQTKIHNRNITISSTKPTRSGYVFNGWSTTATNQSLCVNAGGTFYANGNYTLYAMWKKKIATPEVTITRVNGTKSDGTKYYGKAKVSWKAVSNAKEYEVYRATSKDGTYSLLGTTTKTSYTNYGASAGKTYYYKVKAISGSSSYANSSYSSKKGFTTSCTAPSVSIALSSNKPKLTWKAITGASKYEVYRATSKSGSYSKIATTTSLSYRDSKASSGKTYYYKVKAINSASSYANSTYSSIKSIKSK